ncbi:MAG: glycosyl hydrolase [Acidobacteriota bacterium]|jgi:photosystem II stability/assembly factor-like uncharacterized protein
MSGFCRGSRRARIAPPVLALLLLAILVPPAAGAASAPTSADTAPGPFGDLAYRLVGPAAGGRVARVTGIPGDPLTYYAATASGGVWKSVNGGLDWEPIFDEQTTSSTGSIAVAPSDPNVVYVGTGEANIRGNVSEGDGIYRSTDGGATWEHVWRERGQIGALAVHPSDPDVAWAAVLGRAFGPNPERGVYRTTDGGATWERVLFRDEDTGASDVTLHPTNPRILYAGLWQARRRPWGLTSGGPGSGLFRSRDGGSTWEELTGDGLPEPPWGRVGVRLAPSRPDRIYALIEAAEGGLFRSDDGGATWRRINDSRGLRQRAWYYTTLTVDPTDPETVWFPQVPMLKTIDGGATVRNVAGGGWDYHDVWIDPTDPRRMIVGSDAGVSLSRDGGATWRRPPLPISQVYHVTTDTREPYRVMATLQDWGTASGPSHSLHWGGIYLSDWHPVGGGEAGHIVADPEDPDVIYAGEYLGYLSRFDERTGRARNVSVYPWNGSGHPASDLRHRFQWTAPILLSPHDHRVLYHAAEVLFRSTDGGQSWEAISPDLTRDDESKQRWSGGPITGDNTGVEFYGTIFALAESPVEAPLEVGTLWAGTDDGRVHVTRDGGASWTEVTGNVPGLPAWGTVSAIEPSRRDAGTAYLVVDAHRLDDPSPYLWRTTDFGASWSRLGMGPDGNLPPDEPLFVVREDPVRDGLLFAGGERGVFFSRDGGATWERLRLNLPTVPVPDLRVHGDDLVVGTKGRSIWILDDLTPVREASDETARRPVHLFAPPAAVRWRYRELMGDEAGAGENPPPGALITYSLGNGAPEAEPPEEPELTLEILDSEGRLVRTLRSTPEPLPIGPEHPDWWPGTEVEAALSAAPGMHRTSWDLDWEGAGFVEGSLVDWGDPTAGPTALPGDYTLRLTAGGATATATLTVEPDPRLEVPRAELEAQLAFALELRDDLRRVGAAVERIRSLRDQIGSRNRALAEGLGEAPGAASLVEAGEGILTALDDLERRLHDPDAEVTYDILAGRGGGAKLYSQLSAVYAFSLEGDGAPTQGMREVAAELRDRLAACEDALEELIETRVSPLNARAVEMGVPFVVPR